MRKHTHRYIYTYLCYVCFILLYFVFPFLLMLIHCILSFSPASSAVVSVMIYVSHLSHLLTLILSLLLFLNRRLDASVICISYILPFHPLFLRLKPRTCSLIVQYFPEEGRRHSCRRFSWDSCFSSCSLWVPSTQASCYITLSRPSLSFLFIYIRGWPRAT